MFVVKGELDERTIKLIREAIRLWKNNIDELCDEVRSLVEAKFKNKIDKEEFERKLKLLQEEVSCAEINKIQLQKIVN